MFTFLCRLHSGGENGESLESPLLTEAERGVDAEVEGILHSTSDAQRPSLFTDFSKERRLYYCKMKLNGLNKGIVRKGTNLKRSVQLGVGFAHWSDRATSAAVRTLEAPVATLCVCLRAAH